MRIYILNGVNLNLLGVRDPATYGTQRFEPFLAELRQQYPAVQLDYFQSNSEAALIDKLQEVGYDYDGLIYNPGAFSHYSYGLADIVASVTAPVVEVHMQNPAALDATRPPSLSAKHCRGVIAGLPLRARLSGAGRRRTLLGTASGTAPTLFFMCISGPLGSSSRPGLPGGGVASLSTLHL